MVDQTQFIQEEPLFEDSQLPPIPGEEEHSQKPWFKQPKKIVGVIIMVVIAIIILLIMMYSFLRETSEISPIVDKNGTESKPIEITDDQKRLKELELNLKAADPVQEKLPIPPVLLEIGLPASQ